MICFCKHQVHATLPRLKTVVFFEFSPAKSVMQLPLATAVDKFSKVRCLLTCHQSRNYTNGLNGLKFMKFTLIVAKTLKTGS